MQTLTFIAFLLAPLAVQAENASRQIIPLDSSEWSLTGLNFHEGEKLGLPSRSPRTAGSFPTTVPNDVQLAIPGINSYGQEPDIAGINKKEWWYTRSFPSPRVSSGREVRLIFDGVDYFADVWLNGVKLGSHEGAYTQFSFDITERLAAAGDNYLAVRVTAPWKVPGRSHYEFMKGEYDESWDALPGPGQVVFPLGLHRGVRLEITDDTRIEQLRVSTLSLGAGVARIRSVIRLSNREGAKHLTLRVTVKPENFEGPAIAFPARALMFTGKNPAQEIAVDRDISNPHLWWTWDEGAQNLYREEATLTDASGRIVDRTSAVFGIRTLERDSNLLYKLNGRPLFLRGAWYPMSTLYPAAANRWTYEKDLRLARNANMNHLVNYTVVEKDDFYDLADRLGMLLFVELPFNQEGPIDALNARYPRRAEFMRWSSAEVAQIVQALGNHPSIGVWAPVSEVTENGHDIANADYRIGEAADGYVAFLKRMEKVVEANDPDALYFRSYCDFGEHHFWEGAFFSGTTYDQQFDAKANFVSEYGSLAFYPLEDIKRVVDPGTLWGGGGSKWSPYLLPFNMKKMSYLQGFQDGGMDFLTADIASNVDRRVPSFRDYVEDSQLYQSFLYSYAADAYRRKLFAPISGIRSWMFKSFPEKPVSGFGVIDCFDTPTMAYYAQKRTFARVAMSYAIRYPLESMPAGADWKVPVWISNAGAGPLSGLAVESTLYRLDGEAVDRSREVVDIPADKAAEVLTLDWKLPEQPGIYLLRGRAISGSSVISVAKNYVKVAPRATSKRLRVLLLGTLDWAQPVAGYLANLGAVVTPVLVEPTVIRNPAHPFPDSAAVLRQNYDAIWLAGFDNYWREAPEEWSRTIVEAVRAGVTFVHTGSAASFHGIGEKTAALDLTPLAALLPVEVQHENDAIVQSHYKVGTESNGLAVPSGRHRIVATDAAPQWLRDAPLEGLSPNSFHLLDARKGSTVLLRLDDTALLVTGRFGAGKTIAYLGFSPGGPSTLPAPPVIVDRAVRASGENRLFTIICASILSLAAGEQPSTNLESLIESRTTPLYETLKAVAPTGWPRVTASWTGEKDGVFKAHIRIQNGSSYLFGFRLRLGGPDFRDGRALAIWSEQYFDLLPNQSAESEAEVRTGDRRPLQAVSVIGESVVSPDVKIYEKSTVP